MGLRILNKPLEAYSMHTYQIRRNNDIYINQNDYDSYRGIRCIGLDVSYNTDIYNQCDSTVYYKFISMYSGDDDSKIFEGLLHAGEHIQLPTRSSESSLSLSGEIYFKFSPAAIYTD